MTTLADLQRDPAAPARGPEGLPLRVERTRTFDTPEFAGMTFLEVESKTALNKVSGMPFGWSVNPYRGCSHACSYCLLGVTPILLANGRTTPLADLRRGDMVYGTERRGAYRRYVPTPVLDHWSTVRSAYRVVLEDGTTLVASGDHRFLSGRGWKHVIGAEQGRGRRPHLTENDKLIGTGQFADAPKKGEDYQQGYLCGMVRGDGHLSTSTQTRASGASYQAHRFRLALVDEEALERSTQYLAAGGVRTTAYRFSAATSTRKALGAIINQSRNGVATIRRLVQWPVDPSEEWAKGFLAGVFDAEGGCSGALRISNTDDTILTSIAACLGRFGFRSVLEPPAPNGCRSIRLLGGLRERLRFFHTVDPAITRKRTMDDMALKSDAPLRVASVEPLGMRLPMFDITTGTGDFIANGVVSHNCFARPTHRYLNLSPFGDFERTVVVKTNVAEVLRREVTKRSWRGESVAMGTNTDPYQRCEGRYRLMPGIIAALADGLTPFSILTKGTLITRDVEDLQAASERVPVTAAFTVGMLDEALWRTAEPGTPSPAARLAAVRRLNEAGIPTGVMLAPIMPGLNDGREQLAALVDAAAAAGATHITPIVLHLRPLVREVFWPWLEEHHPELVDRYSALYAKATAPQRYREPVESFVADQRRAAWARHGRPPPPRAWRRPEPREVPVEGGAGAEQLRLL